MPTSRATSSTTVRRFAGALVSLLAMTGALVGSATHRKHGLEAARATAQKDVEALAPLVATGLRAPAEALSVRATRGAQTTAIEALAPAIASQQQVTELANTLAGFTREEEHFAPFVAGAQTGFFLGEKLLFAQVPALVDVLQPVAREATVSGQASTLAAHDGAVWAIGAGRSNAVNPQGLPVVVAFAEPITPAQVQQAGLSHGVAVRLVGGGGRALEAGDAAQLTALQGAALDGSAPCCAKRTLGPGVELLIFKDPTATLAAAAREGTRSTVLFLGVGALVAVLGLLFGFRTGADTTPAAAELLKETTEQLRQSQLQLQRLSQQLSTTAAPRAPTEDDGGLGSTRASARDSRYEIVAPLGEGGMARVSVAVLRGAEGFKRTLVLKRLRPELTAHQELVDQFIDEARLGAALVHSNIVPVFDFGRDAEGYYLAQEYILGRDVDALIEASKAQRGVALEPSLVSLIGQQALQALGYAHTRTNDAGRPLGLVHRDVSPNNLMVSQRGELKLLDFGIVKSDDRVTQTRAGVVKGNVFFMSPEQARALPVDGRSDLFSLGLVLYAALAGGPLYAGDNVYELLNRAAAGLTPEDRERVRAHAGPLADVLLTALNTDPAGRYPDAEAFSRALMAAVPPAPSSELQALMEQLFAQAFAAERARFQVQG